MLTSQRYIVLRSTCPCQTISCRPLSVHRRRQPACRIHCEAGQPKESKLTSVLLRGTAALLAAAFTHSAQPAWADLETVAPATVSSLAKALPQQKVEKGKVWAVFILGAAGLFAGTILLENNEKLFPAISKANKAMAMARQSQQAKSRIEEAIDVDGDGDERLQSAVVAGLNEARQRAASSPDSSSSGPPEAQQPSLEQHADASTGDAHVSSQQNQEAEPSSDRQRKDESELSVNAGSRSSNG